jgi:hypothetical protein
MKKFYMTMVAMLCGVAAMAQDTTDGLYVNDIQVDKGTTALVIPVCLKNTLPVAAISFRTQLPTGVTFKVVRGKLQYTLNEDRAPGYSVDYQVASDNNPMVSVYDKYPFDLNDGAIINIQATISSDVAAVDGTYQVKLYAISCSAPAVPEAEMEDFGVTPENNDGRSYTVSGEMPQVETTFNLTIGKGTGINTINADDENAPIYNVAGQRVSKAQKGVFIQNGKKVAVK